jgi:hypothetical protein
LQIRPGDNCDAIGVSNIECGSRAEYAGKFNVQKEIAE